MKRFSSIALAAVAFATLAAGAARAGLIPDQFRIRTAQDLMALCSADPSDPLYDDATNFCHGFVHGAWQYHQAQANGPEGVRVVCPPDPPPTRSEAIAMFVEWAGAHPQYNAEPAVETLFRFLVGKYPCPDTAEKKGAAK